MQVVGSLVKALKALHEAGYAHCNIKPSNILEHEKHTWVLSDYASSCPLGTAPSTPQPCWLLASMTQVDRSVTTIDNTQV